MVTCSDLPTAGASGRLLTNALATAGMIPRIAAWDDAAVPWHAFDGVLLHACWNYHLKFDEFQAWLAALATSTVPVWNPLEVVQWNSRKTYLSDLARLGIPVLPAVYVGCGDRVRLAEVMQENGWHTAVIKPVIGADGFLTFRVRLATAESAQELLYAAAAHGGAIIQPLASQIEAGEYSFVFIDSQYSHAMLKTVRHGDFRTGTEHGGTVRLVRPDAALVAEAGAVAARTAAGLLYSRVDALIINGSLTLMELELIEPWLGFDLYPPAATALARALAARLRGKPSHLTTYQAESWRLQ